MSNHPPKKEKKKLRKKKKQNKKNFVFQLILLEKIIADFSLK